MLCPGIHVRQDRVARSACRTEIFSVMKAAGVDAVQQIKRMQGGRDLPRKEIKGRRKMHRATASACEQAKAGKGPAMSKELRREAKGPGEMLEWLAHKTSGGATRSREARGADA